MSAVTTIAPDITARIESALNTIRPYLEADGGNVRIQEITAENILRLEFMGNCGNCPMSTMTFKAGVEEAVLRMVPEIQKIEVINLTAL